MVIGRGRRREHPMDTSEGVKWPSGTTGVVQLPVAHAHTQGNAEGIKWPSVTSGSHVTTAKKKAREKAGHAQNILPDRNISGQGLFRSRDWGHFRSKGHTRVDIAQLPVAHGQNILPDRARDLRHVPSRDWRPFWSRHFRSRDFRLLHRIAPPQILTSRQEIFKGK